MPAKTFTGKLEFVDIGVGHFELHTETQQVYRLVPTTTEARQKVAEHLGTYGENSEILFTCSAEEPEVPTAVAGGTVKPLLFI